jgi:hypothetical protein
MRSRDRGPIYTIRVRAKSENIHALRGALKALRRFGLRCMSIVTETPPSPTGARRRREIRSERRESTSTIMDMRQFSGEHFIKVDDVRDGPIKEKIAGIREGRFGKPDLVFTNGDILSLNSTNNNVLMRAFGTESNDWIELDVELYQGEIEYQGRMQEAVRVRPISSPPIKKTVIGPKPVPPKTKPASLRGEMDDDIPF